MTEDWKEEISPEESEEQAVIEQSVEGVVADGDPFEHAFQYAEPEQPKTSNWPVVVLAVCMIIVLVVGVLWGTGAFDKKGQEQQGPATAAPFGVTDLSAEVVASCKDVSLSNGVFAFYMEMEYLNSDAYAAYDKTRPLKEQDAAAFDKLVTSAKTQFEKMVALNALAKANNVTLNKAALNTIEKAVTSVDVSAFHNGVSSADVREFYTLYYTSWLMESVLYNHASFDDETIDSIFEEFADDYITCDFATFYFMAGEGGDFATMDEAKAAAERLADCDTMEDFRAEVVQFLLDAGECKTEEEAIRLFDSKYVGTNVGYTEEYDILKWMFADDTRVGDTTVVEEEDYVSVYMLTRAKSRDTSPIGRLRYISLSFDAYGDDTTVKALADEITAAFAKSDGSRAAFEELVRTHTADFNTYDGDMWEFADTPSINEEVNTWIFDDARKEGDVFTSKTSKGYYIFYYMEERELWYGRVLTTAQQDVLNAAMDELSKTYPVTFHDTTIQQNEF